MSKAKTVVALNVTELKDVIRHMINNNKFLQENNKPAGALEVVGPAGLGKTSVIIQMAEEFNLHCVKLNLSQLEEVENLVGYPHKELEVKNDVGETRWIPESAVPKYIDQKFKPTGEKRMGYAIPEWIQGREGGGILMLDDYSRASERFIQATMELVQRQEYLSWKLPRGWTVILTSNPSDGNYLVNELDPAQKSRFTSVNMKFDAKVWSEWADREKIDTRCINFVLLNPEIVSKDGNHAVNPRSITTFFNNISSIKDFDAELPLIQMLGEGSVGPDISSMFTAFINNRLDRIITPAEILLGKNEDNIMASIRSCVGKKGGKYRADIASTIITRTANFALLHAEDNSITSDIISRLIRFITEEDMIEHDLKYIFVKRLFTGNKQKFQKLLDNKDVIKLTIK